ncbi:hypothetical protein Dimus_037675 [Dionaea muscipula]
MIEEMERRLQEREQEERARQQARAASQQWIHSQYDRLMALERNNARMRYRINDLRFKAGKEWLTLWSEYTEHWRTWNGENCFRRPMSETCKKSTQITAPSFLVWKVRLDLIILRNPFDWGCLSDQYFKKVVTKTWEDHPDSLSDSQPLPRSA